MTSSLLSPRPATRPPLQRSNPPFGRSNSSAGTGRTLVPFSSSSHSSQKGSLIVNRLQKWVHGNWSVPIVSGVLIVISFGLQHIAGGTWNTVLTPQWWLDAGAHATHSAGVFTLA